jgi:iron complex transport system substrate-binding protein
MRFESDARGARATVVLGVAVMLLMLLQHATADTERQPAAGTEASRIVSVGGGVTEIVYALDFGADVVGVDTSSVYPETATKLPQVGYQRQLSAEGILSLKPTLVLASTDAGPPAALDQLRTAGVTVVSIPADATVAGASARVRAIAQALGVAERGEGIVQRLETDLASAKSLTARVQYKPKVLFIYARGAGTLNVSGTGTAADEMIRVAGAENAVTAYEGFKPFTAEAAVAAAADVLLLPARGLDSLGGPEGLLALPGIAMTPAGRAKRIVTMDDLYLLGFGPRTGLAVQELAHHLHPELRREASSTGLR